jgi:hypothetical protein
MQRRNHRPKSARHVRAANARWRAVEARAEAEREDGIEDRPAYVDTRQPFVLPLLSAGGRELRIEPRHGYISWRAVDLSTGEVVGVAALKTLLRDVAASLPRQLSLRNDT